MSGRRLSLHHLTALDAPPLDLVSIAGRLRCDHVTLFTHVPEQARGFYPCVSLSDVTALRDALAEADVTVCNLEVFPLDGDGDISRFDEGLRVGAALGATRATAHVHNVDGLVAAAKRFAAFSGVASDHGIVAGLEFNGFSAVKDIASAATVVRDAGCGALVLDVLHLMRNGADIAAVGANADLIGYAQLCDGPLQIVAADAWREAVRERGLPGEGAFPLAAILARLGGDLVVEAEIPQAAAQKAGVSAFERARRAMESVRSTLAAV